MEMATHSRILAWEVPWIEEPGGLQSMGSQKESQYDSNATTAATTKNLHTVLQSAAPIHIPISSVGGFPFLPTLSGICYLLTF